jgi:hypothetical protein
MSVILVVARYNEDITWTNYFSNVIIYNKGAKLTKECNYNEVLLSNVGREGHTYYKYIVDNYDNLADYIVFLQGYPFDHSPNLINNLNKIYNNHISIEFEFLSENVVDCNLNGGVYHHGLPLIQIYEKLFNERKENLDFRFGSGAQFIVSKQNILKRPKEFYLKVVELLQHDINPIEGFVIERFHKLILG